MIRLFSLLVIVFFFCQWSFVLAQTTTFNFNKSDIEAAVEFSKSITADELKQHLFILASDSLEGRETGTVGNQKAGNYIAKQFKENGLTPKGNNGNYFQNIGFSKKLWTNNKLIINNIYYKNLSDYYSLAWLNPDTFSIQTDEVIFLGYGIDSPNYSDYTGIDVRGKTILIYGGEPLDEDSISYITHKKEISDWTKNLNLKIVTALTNQVKAVLVIDTDFNNNIGWARKHSLNGNFSITTGVVDNANEFAPNVFLSPDLAKLLLGDNNISRIAQARDKIKSKGISVHLSLTSKIDYAGKVLTEKLESANVIGMIEGADATLKKEFVFITAHYDHLGKKGDEIFHGADDNASGTSAVLELAEAFAEAKKAGNSPKRSVVCMLVTGEEKGLKGSEFFVKYPTVDLSKIVADVNIDMIGRVDTFHQNNNYVYIIGANKLSTDLHNINEEMNERFTRLTLDYKYNDENDPNRFYYRSDHYNFAKNNIPAIFFFNGTHCDYHQPTDVAEKIDFNKMERIGKLAFLTAWELADRAERIKIDKENK
ncbi:MAG: M28 family peptidase [Saprospiraceae bacterium]|nr:M28 family peptidase [Saprospiraceae bacterium]MBP7699656.1 M28 family peptidase [Saprospiraceae bacterium]